MSRTLLHRAAILLVAVAFVGCRDESSQPLAPGAVSRNHLPSDTHITALIGQLFLQQNAGSVTALWNNVVNKLESGHAPEAREKLLKVAEYIQSKTNNITAPANKSKKQAAQELIDLMVAYAFGRPGMGSDATIAVVTPGTATVVHSPDSLAAIDLPANAFSQPTVLLVYRDPVQSRAACSGPLKTTLCQYPLFYHFDPYPHTRLNVPARLGVCIVNSGAGAVPDSSHHRIRLAHDKPADATGYVQGGTVRDSIEILPYAYVGDFLKCGATTTLTSVMPQPPRSLADRGLRTLGRVASAVIPFASPTIAHAIDRGGGGTVLSFSNFNVVDPGEEEDEHEETQDATPPVVTANVDGTRSVTGWYTSSVTVTWSVTDHESDVTTTCASSTVTSDTRGQVFRCTATSTGGTTTDSVTVRRDATPPVVTSTVTGTPGANGWYISNVGVSWAPTDATSGVASEDGCATAEVISDTPSSAFTCIAVDSAGNSGTKSVTVRRDATPPLITKHVAGPEGSAGWFTGDVNVSWTVTDPTSGVVTQPGCTPTSVTSDTPGVTFVCSPVNGAGLTNSESAFVKRDATVPDIGYSSHPDTYTVDQTVAITCSASDALSGLASNTCANIAGDAYSFGVGMRAFSAAATDRAGNGNTASTSFEVRVTSASLCTLTRRFSSSAGIGNSLCAKLNAYAASLARGSSVSAAGQLGAYINEVRAQSGKAIASEKADILVSLAFAL